MCFKTANPIAIIRCNDNKDKNSDLLKNKFGTYSCDIDAQEKKTKLI